MADNKFLGDQFFRVLSTSRLPSMRQSLDQDSEKQKDRLVKHIWQSLVILVKLEVTNTNKEMAKTMLKIVLDFKFSVQNVEVLVTTFKSKTTKRRMVRTTPNEVQV